MRSEEGISLRNSWEDGNQEDWLQKTKKLGSIMLPSF